MNPESSITIPTEEQVVAFFKSKLGAFQAKLPGYATLKLDFSTYSSGSDEVRWSVYHEQNGYAPDKHGNSLEDCFRWHFTGEAMQARIKSLRDEAAEKLMQADQLEANGRIPAPAYISA